MAEPASSVYLTGYPGDRLREALWNHYRTCLNDITSSDGVLVLTPARPAWEPRLRALDVATGAHRVATPLGWIQQELALWWPLVEERLVAAGVPAEGASGAGPTFVAVDLAQHLLARFAAPLADEEGGLIRGARSPVRMQRLQALDTLARGVENEARLAAPGADDAHAAAIRALLTDAGAPAPPPPVLGLAAAIAGRLAPAFGPEQQGFDVQLGAVLAAYAAGMLRWRLLDHALAPAVFTDLLWPEARYREHLLRSTPWLVIEELDELPARLITLIEELQAGGTRVCASLKSDPGAREGERAFRGGLREYLGAAPARAWRLATPAEVVPAPAAETPLADLGRALAAGLYGAPRRAEVAPARVRQRLNAPSVVEMVHAVGRDLARVLAEPDMAPSRVALVAPALGPTLIWLLRAQTEKLGVPLYVFAGTNMLTDHRPVRLLLTVARLCHAEWALAPSRFELLELLETITGENPLKLGRLSPVLCAGGRLADPAELPAELGATARARYEHLWAFVHQAHPADLEGFFRRAFAELWAPFQPRRPLGSAADEAGQREVSQIGQLIELARRFHEVDARIEGDVEGRGRRFIDFLRDQPIAERPFFKREPHHGAIMLATASQLAEKGFAEPADWLEHLFVLDFSSERWWKSDRRELSNARVLVRERPPGPYGQDEEEHDATEKLARVLQACCLKVRGTLWLHACLTDEEGQANDGGLPHLLAGALGRLDAEVGA